jgi:hypothetical protein
VSAHTHIRTLRWTLTPTLLRFVAGMAVAQVGAKLSTGKMDVKSVATGAADVAGVMVIHTCMHAYILRTYVHTCIHAHMHAYTFIDT